MRKIEELRPRDIAQRLGISMSMVEKHLARGLDLLAEYLDVAETIIDQHVDSNAASRAPKIDGASTMIYRVASSRRITGKAGNGVGVTTDEPTSRREIMETASM